MCNAHAHCDAARFTYDVNHVTRMSPAFTFHSCHVGMRWHVIIGVCVEVSPYHHGFASHMDGIDMTSLCSHHIHITLLTSSLSDCDIIATCMNHDCRHGV